MNLLCAYHAKSPDACRWVIANAEENSDNITVTNWVKACKEHLQSLYDGPDLVSIDNNRQLENRSMLKTVMARVVPAKEAN